MTREELEARRLKAAEELRRGVPVPVVAYRFRVTRVTAYRWAKRVRQGSSLLRTKAKGRPRTLSLETVAEALAPYKTSGITGSKASQLVFEKLGYVYHPDHMLRIMRGLGIRASFQWQMEEKT